MAEGSSTLQIVNTLLLAGVLATTLTVTCSNDRLEQQVIRLSKSIDSGSVGGGGGSGGAPVHAARVAGDPSPVVASGWGGRKANVTYVEGAVPNAPLRLADKPRPQNDWYISRSVSVPGSLNFFTSNEGLMTRITRVILGRMIEIDNENPTQPLPELATRWDVSADKLTYTYFLRRGVQFADGRPFTAADVKFAFDVMRDPEVQADHLRSEFEDVESLTTPDPFTVVVKYKKKYWKGLVSVGYSLRVLNKGWYEEQIPNYAAEFDIADFSTEPGKPGFADVFNEIRIPCPGAGPYYLASKDDYNDQFIAIVQNPFYFGTQVHPTWYNFVQQRWVFISDAVAAFEAFRKQEFDVTVVDSDRYEDQLKDDPTISGISRYFEYDHMSLGWSYITWNCRQAPFDDPRVRTAMTHLMNRKWLLEELERNKGTIAVCKTKRIYPNYSNDLVPHAFDPERAKELLAEAGWTDSDGDGVLDRDGERFEFEFKVPSGRTWFQRIGGALKDACAGVGIRMDVRPLEWSKFIDDFYERRFDAVCLYSQLPDPWIDPYDEHHSSTDRPRGGNSPGWRNDEVDTLVEAMRLEFDAEKRIAMFHRFNKIFYDEQPETLLVHGTVSVLQNNRFEDVQVRPTGLRNFDFWVKPENVLHK